MLIDAAQLTENSRLEADVVIAGGGVAGIALARQLADSGLSVLVLESGGENPEQRTQALYEGTMTMGGPGNDARRLNEYLVSSRLRCFGGSGNVWGGKCAPLDPVDFDKRDWIRHSGWPIDRAALQPFYDRACDLLELPRFAMQPADVVGADEPLLAGRASSLAIRPRCFTRYTGLAPDGAYASFKRSASDHPRVRVCLHANATAIRVGADGRRVESLEVRELDGRRHSAVARTYVLAAGGIENVRLMLASNDVHREGVGNHSDWLGRAFQGHTTISQGEGTCMSLLRDESKLGLFNNQQRTKPHAVIGLSDAAQHRYRTTNFTATLMDDRAAAPKAEACVTKLAQRFADVPATARRHVYFMIEHTPNRNSRITLSRTQRDELGLPRVHLDMRYGDPEFDSIGAAIGCLATELGRLEIGRVRWSGRRDQLIQLMESPSRHHMGATRMARSPREGVVDEQCRVHGVDNLYVAGSSVFPTSGIANPTLTLLALTFRLGDHLGATMKASA
ncbi:MAG TPA: GMC family oxidoreductase [Steroidobacteraceae bacterium]|nr:GMC family oxidoreductase [Steroidobacteraceae bacterium]